jgi:HlyD family secretion protein
LTAILTITLAACESTEKTFMVGTLERDRIELRVESNEPISAIHFQDGQYIEAGELVLEQDPARHAMMLAQVSALRDQATARLAELQRGPREEAIRQARAQLESSQAVSRNSAANLQRAKEIFERKLSDQARMDTAETRWKTAVAAEHAAKEALDSLLNGTTVEELQQASAVLDAANARVSQAQLDLERLKIYAPTSGVLDKRLFQLGERPLPGTTVVVLLDSARIYARIYVPEHIRSRVQPGNQLTVRIGGHPNLTGTVSWVSSDASFTPYFALTEHDRSRLSYLAEINVPGADSLPSGLPLEVDFPTGFSQEN